MAQKSDAVITREKEVQSRAVGGLYKLTRNTKMQTREDLISWSVAVLDSIKDETLQRIGSKHRWYFVDPELPTYKQIAATYPSNGVPSNVRELLWLIHECKMISDKDLEDGAGLSPAEIKIVHKKDSDGLWQKYTGGAFDSLDSSFSPGNDREGALKIINKIIYWLSGKQFPTWNEYHANLKDIKDAVQAVKNCAIRFQEADIAYSISQGFIVNWADMMEHTRKLYKLDRETWSLLGYWNKLEEIERSDRSFKQKCLVARQFLISLMITEKPYPDMKDFENDRIYMSHPEEPSPILSFLIMFIMSGSSRKRNKNEWENMALQLTHTIGKSKFSYKTFIENKILAYQLIEEKIPGMKDPSSSSREGNVNEVRNQESESEDVNAVSKRRSQGQKQNDRGRKNETKSLKTKCFECSTFYKENKYHDGGRGQYARWLCPFKNGTKKRTKNKVNNVDDGADGEEDLKNSKESDEQKMEYSKAEIDKLVEEKVMMVLKEKVNNVNRADTRAEEQRSWRNNVAGLFAVNESINEVEEKTKYSPSYDCNTIDSNKSKEGCPACILFDTGAAVSVVPEKVLVDGSYFIGRIRKKGYVAANSGPMDLWDNYCDVLVKGKFGIILLKDVVISRAKSDQILVGRDDLRDLKIDFIYSSPIPYIQFGQGRNMGKKYAMTVQNNGNTNNIGYICPVEENSNNYDNKRSLGYDFIHALDELYDDVLKPENSFRSNQYSDSSTDSCESTSDESYNCSENSILSSGNNSELNTSESVSGSSVSDLSSIEFDAINELGEKVQKRVKKKRSFKHRINNRKLYNRTSSNRPDVKNKRRDLKRNKINSSNNSYVEWWRSNMGNMELPEYDRVCTDVKDLDNISTITLLGDPCYSKRVIDLQCFDSPLAIRCENDCECIDPDYTENLIKKSNDYMKYLHLEIERRKDRMSNSYTHKDISIDTKLEDEYPGITDWLRNLCDNYKDLFVPLVGYVGKEFDVSVRINQPVGPRRVGHNKKTELELRAFINKVLDDVASGVLVSCEAHGILPINTMNTLVIEKKDDDGFKIDLMTKCRVVVDSGPVNDLTSYVGTETDALQPALDFAQVASKNGLCIKTDFSECYSTVGLKKDLWPHFCINIPGLGNYCYTRCVQGWGPSAQLVQDVLSKIMWPLRENLRKYMDDVILGNYNNVDDFKYGISKMFSIMRRFGLRMKGSKTFIGWRTFNYLGYQVDNGTLYPNSHYVKGLQDLDYKQIDTVKKMEKFMGCCVFLARFLKRPQDVFTPLRDAMKGKNSAEKIIWTEDLINHWEKAKLALHDLIRNHAFYPDRKTVLVVDTSKHGSGAFLYQIDNEGNPKIIRLFQRVKKGHERVNMLSSCHIELNGLVAAITCFWNYIEQAQEYNPITIVTDSRSVMLLWRQMMDNNIQTKDSVLSRALWELRRVRANVVHSGNTSNNIKLADFLSRELKIFKTSMDCIYPKECMVCTAIGVNEIDLVEVQRNFPQKLGEICKKNRELHNKGELYGKENFSNYETKGFIESVNDDDITRLKKDTRLNLSQIKQTNYNLDTLLADHAVLLSLQMRCRVLKNIIKAKHSNQTSFKTGMTRECTIWNKLNPTLDEHGVLYLRSYDSFGNETKIIPISQDGAWIALNAVHNTIGHRSASQLQKKTEEVFRIIKDGKNDKIIPFRILAAKYVSSCVKCFLLKACPVYKKVNMTPIPLANDIFVQIVVDECTRTFDQKTFKVLVAMESVSRYICAFYYEKDLNGPSFAMYMSMVKSILTPHPLHKLKIEVRLDKAGYHKSHIVEDTLKDLNIELVFHESSSWSKNSLSDIDGKLKSFSENLVGAKNRGLPVEIAVQLAVQVCNTTINESKLTPVEIFTGRKSLDGEFIQIETVKILQNMKDRRAVARKSREKENFKKAVSKNLELVPYSDPRLKNKSLNENLVGMRKGDYVRVNKDFDKNEGRSLYIIMDIHWKQRVIKARRHTPHGSARPHFISFERIDEVFKPESINAFYESMGSGLPDALPDRLPETVEESVWYDSTQLEPEGFCEDLITEYTISSYNVISSKNTSDALEEWDMVEPEDILFDLTPLYEDENGIVGEEPPSIKFAEMKPPRLEVADPPKDLTIEFNKSEFEKNKTLGSYVDDTYNDSFKSEYDISPTMQVSTPAKQSTSRNLLIHHMYKNLEGKYEAIGKPEKKEEIKEESTWGDSEFFTTAVDDLPDNSVIHLKDYQPSSNLSRSCNNSSSDSKHSKLSSENSSNISSRNSSKSSLKDLSKKTTRAEQLRNLKNKEKSEKYEKKKQLNTSLKKQLAETKKLRDEALAKKAEQEKKIKSRKARLEAEAEEAKANVNTTPRRNGDMVQTRARTGGMRNFSFADVQILPDAIKRGKKKK